MLEEIENKVDVPELICTELKRDIKKELDQSCLYYRLFGRVKTSESICKKLNRKQYSVDSKKMQDIIGLRIVVYFNDDIDLCRSLLKDMYQLDNEEYDHLSTEEFKPVRINMVFTIPEQLVSYIRINDDIPIDKTFEVQIRTIFSEGWHEVEHDLRYKRKADWRELPVQSRMLNGIFATLQTCDWSILQLFDDVAHEHYKRKNWLPMCISHFRLKLLRQEDDKEKIISILNDSSDLPKTILRFNRLKLINLLKDKYNDIPFTLLNVIYIINLEEECCESLKQTTPARICEDYSARK